MRKPGSLLTSFTLTLTGLLALPVLTGATSARAATAVAEPSLAGFHQIVASSGYVFLSEGIGSYALLSGAPSTGLVVTDSSGNYITTVDSGDGVEGIALSPDGTTLYAALSAKNAVAAIDVSTITSAAPTQVLYPLASTDIPYGVAVQSGKVWVSYLPGVAGAAAIGDINLSATTPAAAFEPGATSKATYWYSPADLAADPSNSGVMVAVQPDLSDASAAVLNTTTDPATVVATGSVGGFSQCGFIGGIAVNPGGKTFIAGCGSAEVYSTASSNGALSTTAVRSYPAGHASIATDTAGTVALGTGQYTMPAGVVSVYLPGGKLANTFALGAGVAGNGLAFSPDNTRLYAVTGVPNYATGRTAYSLRLMHQPTLPQPTLTLSAPATSPITRGVVLSGKLTLPGGKLPPAGTPLTIARTGPAPATFTASTLANGTFALTDHTAGNALGTYTYTAVYAGSATVAPGYATRIVQVVKFSPGLTLNVGPTTINYGTTSTITAHLGAAYTNRTVWIYVQLAGHAKALIRDGAVNSLGNFTVTYRAPYNATYSATYTGDARVAPATVSHGIRVRAAVYESLGGYYGTSGSYHLYRGTQTLAANISVAPGKTGQCVRLEVDQYYQGAWLQIGVSPCFGLGFGSRLIVNVGLSRLASSSGPHYRIRVDYSPTTDTANLGNDSGWQYFIVY